VIYERIPAYSGRIKRGGVDGGTPSMDFVSAVLSLSQKHERRAQILVARSVQKGVCSRKERTAAYTTPGMRAREEASAECGRTKRKRNGGDGRIRGEEEPSIRRNKRGIFVPATNPNGEERTFLFSFIRQPTYLPTFMSAVSED